MTKRKAASASSDFKKIRRAKVGQKARAPANVTDTTFQSASIRVSSSASSSRALDDGDRASSGPFLSGRGKSLEELLDKLRHHPAPAARLSSAKGLRDLVTRAVQASSGSATLSSSASASASVSAWIASHLSTLLPAVARCALMDEDDDVRRCGLDVLRILVVQHKNEEANADTSWRPFLPLIVAHVGSALNSMDRNTRMDGARAVMCLGAAGQGAGEGAPTHPKGVLWLSSSMLPALVRLLKEQSQCVVAVGTEAAATAAAAATKAGAPAKSKNSASSSEKSKLKPTSSSSSPRTPVQGSHAPSKLEKRQHQDTMTALRALLVVLRSVNASNDGANAAAVGTETNGGGPTRCLPAVANDDVASPSSIRVITTASAAATSFPLSHQPALIRNVADWSRLARRCNGGADTVATLGGFSSSSSSSSSSSTALGAATLVDLMEGLRDVLLDGSGTDSPESSAPGGRARTEYDDELLDMAATILPLAMRLLANRAANNPGPVQTRLRRALAMILSSLLRGLAEPEQQPSCRREASASTLPTQLCLAILAVAPAYPELSLVKLPPNERPAPDSAAAPGSSAAAADKAVSAVVEYTVDQMRGSGMRPARGPGTPSADASVEWHQPSPPLASILRVLERLLESDRPAAVSQKGRLLRAFVAAFFASSSVVDESVERDERNEVESGAAIRGSWSRSAAVRRAVHLAHRVVFVPDQYKLEGLRNEPDDLGAPGDDAVRDRYWAARKVLRCIPTLVVSWRADFVPDSYSALVLMHEVVRRLSPPAARAVPLRLESAETECSDDVLAYLPAALTPILEPEQQSAGYVSSTFERYPEPLQRLALGIFVLWGRLPCPAVRALGKICSRSLLGQSQPALTRRMAEAVMEAVHSIRRRMSMRNYLGFVLDAACAIHTQGAEQQQSSHTDCRSESESKAGLPMRQALRLDRSLQLACRLLVECGPPPKVLSMLWPFVVSCLTDPDSRTACEDLLQTRTAVTLVAYLLQYSSDSEPLATDVQYDFDLLSRSLARFCTSAFAATEEDDPNLEPFVRPVLSFLSIQPPEVLPTFFRAALLSNKVGRGSTTSKVSSFQSLCYLVRSAELQDVLGGCVEELIELTRAQELSSSPPDTIEGDGGRSSGPDQIWLHRLQADLEAMRSRGEDSSPKAP